MQIIVLGLPNESATIVARLLNMMGLYFAPEGLEFYKNEDAQSFLWERRDIRNLHDGILMQLGTTREQVSQFDPTDITPSDLNAFQNGVQQLLTRLDAQRPWFIKDPSLSFLLPLWRPLLECPLIIHVVQHPLHFQYTNNPPVDLAYWEKYTLANLHHAADLPACQVDYADVLANPVAAMKTIYTWLQTQGVNKIRLPGELEIQAFANKHLSESQDKLDSEWLLPPYAKLWEHLQKTDTSNLPTLSTTSNLVLNAHAQSAIAQQRLEQEIETLKRDKISYKQRVNEELNKTQQALENQVSLRRQQVAALEKEKLNLSALEKKSTALEQELQDTRRQAIQFFEQIHVDTQAVFSSLTWKIGSLVTETLRIALRRPPGTVQDHIDLVISDFKDWKRRGDNRSLPAPEEKSTTDAWQTVKYHNLQLTHPVQTAVDIIVCIHNALEDVKRCLMSVVDNTPAKLYTLFVVNDGSNEETSRWLQEFCQKYSNTRLIENKAAQGYTKAANQGMRASSADYVIMLNSDTIVPTLWLNNLLECGESDETIGILGPLSNAASWQSVPERFDAEGDWAINELPPDYNVTLMAELVNQVSDKQFPKVAFVNGFCFAVKRKVIDTIGYLDEESFPKGYGEENDYCLRAAEAGFTLAIADQSYVFHAKSKSYTHERRIALAQAGSTALKNKHGQEKISQGAAELKNHPYLETLRERIKHAQDSLNTDFQTKKLQTLRILFILPVAGVSGGAHSVAQEVMGLRDLGIDAQIANEKRFQKTYEYYYQNLCQSGSVFFYKDSEELLEYATQFHVVVATVWHTPQTIAPLAKQRPDILFGYYIQDYEPWFFDDNPHRQKIAFESYTLITNAVLFAKTDWIRDMVKSKHGVDVAKVSPSLDHKEFYPVQNAVKDNSTITIAAMVRPATPRRSPEKTLRVLKQVQQAFPKKVKILIFGGSDEDLKNKTSNVDLDFEYQNQGVLLREQVPEVYRKSDIFVDFSEYQAFGRTGLEAMACGCAVILPEAGGVHEYAVHEENALIVDTKSESQLVTALNHLVTNNGLRHKLQQNSLETAKKYSIRRAVLSEINLFRHAWNNRYNSGLSAVKPFVNKPFKITAVVTEMRNGKPTGSAYIRLLQPLTHPSVLNSVNIDIKQLHQALLQTPDLFIVQRNALYSPQMAEKLIKHCKSNNIRLAVEIDDDLFTLYEKKCQENPHEAIHLKPVEDALRLLIMEADGVVASTPPLQAALQKLHSNVICVPNALDEKLWYSASFSKPTAAVSKDKINFLYMGTRTHADDLELIRESFLRIQKEYGRRKVSLTIIGALPKGQEMFGDVLEIDENRGRTYADFVAWLREQNQWHIGLIPLLNNEFNRKKSYIKFLDYSALGLASICTDIEPYREIVRHGENGLLVDNTTESWYNAMKKLVDDYELRENISSNAFQEVMEAHTLKQNANKFVQAYHSILES